MIIEDYINTFRKQLDNDSHYEIVRLRYYAFSHYIDLFLNTFENASRHFTNVEVVFVGSKLIDLVCAANKKVNCLILSKGIRSYKESKKTGFPSYYINRFVYDLAKHYRREIPSKNILKSYGDLMERTCELLQNISPKAVVFFSNTGFFERHLNIACAKLNIPTHRIQHGWFFDIDSLYQVSNKFWVWGEYFLDKIKVKDGQLASNTNIFGYPHNLDKQMSRRIQPINKLEKACFIGQAVKRDNKYYTYFEKLEKLNLIAQVLLKHGILLYYRPHPTEWMFYSSQLKKIKSKPYIKITDRSETIKEAYRNYDLFLSAYSTALLEAAIYGKYTIQVLIGNVQPMLEDGGISYINNVKEELPPLIDDSSLNTGLSNYYIDNSITFENRVQIFLDKIL